jgi:hypothetical protein
MYTPFEGRGLSISECSSTDFVVSHFDCSIGEKLKRKSNSLCQDRTLFQRTGKAFSHHEETKDMRPTKSSQDEPQRSRSHFEDSRAYLSATKSAATTVDRGTIPIRFGCEVCEGLLSISATNPNAF